MATVLDRTGAPILDSTGVPIDDGTGFADPPAVRQVIATTLAALYPPPAPPPNSPPLPLGPPPEIINACSDCAMGLPHADDNGGASPAYPSDPANPPPPTIWQTVYYVDSNGSVILKIQRTDGTAQYQDTGLLSAQPMGTMVVDLRLLSTRPRGRVLPALLGR